MPRKLEGELGINTGQIDLDPIIAQTGDSAYATKQTEYATTAEDAAGQTNAQPTGFNALAMNVHLTVPDDLVVKGSDLKTPGAPIGLGAINVTLGGDIRLTKDPGKSVRLVGSVKTIRGFYDFQNRRFDILRDGSVRFDGLEEINPTLDIRTERVIQAVTAHVNVQGTLQNPEIVLSSTPPLEQADILSLIVFNQPLNAVGEGQQISLAQRAQAMATGAVAGQLAKSIGNALNLNEFEINMAPENGGGPEVTLGQQVGQNLYVKVEQGIGDASQTNFILEYELTKWLRLQDECPARLQHAGTALSAHAGQRRRYVVLLQLLGETQSSPRRTRRIKPLWWRVSLRDRQRRHLHARVVEAGSAPEIRERIGRERRGGDAVARAAPP